MSARIFRAEDPKLFVDVEAFLLPKLAALVALWEASIA